MNMSRWNEDLAIAFLQANVHGRKKKIVSILDMAEAVQFLVNKHKNQEKVASIVKIMSREMVREFYNISSLPEEIKKLIQKKKIRIDVAQRLFKIDDKNRQIKTARAIAELSAHDARKIIDYVINNPEKTVEEGAKIVRGSKNIVKKYDTLVIPLEKEDYIILNNLARRENLTATRFAKKLVEQWITRKRSKKR